MVNDGQAPRPPTSTRPDGNYTAGVTLTDTLGTTGTLVFTGQTMMRNGKRDRQGNPERDGADAVQPRPRSQRSELQRRNHRNQNQVLSATMPLAVSNGDPAGWNLSVTSTQWTTGGASPKVLPLTATTVTNTPIVACEWRGACNLAANSIGYPYVLPAGADRADGHEAVQRRRRDWHRTPDGHPDPAAIRAGQLPRRYVPLHYHRDPEQRAVMMSSLRSLPVMNRGARSRRPAVRTLLAMLVTMMLVAIGIPAGATAGTGDTLGTAVLKVGSTITVTASANPVAPTSDETLTATFAVVTGNEDVVPTGIVSFLDNGVRDW